MLKSNFILNLKTPKKKEKSYQKKQIKKTQIKQKKNKSKIQIFNKISSFFIIFQKTS